MSPLSTLLFYNTLTYSITYLQLPSNSSTLVFFTTDHFILFVHSSRMFYYFVYLHVHVVGSCPAIVVCRPPACCLLACCHWGHRVVPFILECAQLWATFFIILCVESAVAPSSACWRLMLGRLVWSASSVADLTCSELHLAFTGTFTVCYQLKLPLISTILHPFTPNNQFTSLIKHR